jgi:acyl-CoA-binding protein
MYAQSEPGEGFTSTLEGAVDRDRLLSVRSMTSPTGDPDKVTLFYGEAWSLVSFMVEEYGEEKFAQLYAVFKDGSTTDNALQQVYGFDQEGLEDAWRASLGLAPRQRATATPSPTATAAQPSPAATPTPDNGSQAGGDGGDVPWATAAALGAAGFAFVAVSLGGGVFLARRLRRR